jgi:DNA-directed RNA polymerase specialized sigma24 family protein
MPASRGPTALELRFAKRFEELRASGKTDRDIYWGAAGELKQLADEMVRRGSAGPSFTAKSLYQDTFIDLFPLSAPEFRWEQAHQYCVAAARTMRDLKVKYIRRKMANKGPGGKVNSLDELREKGYEASDKVFEAQAMQAFAVEEAMQKLREQFPEREEAIQLTYWGDDSNPEGLAQAQVAELLNMTPDQVKYALRAGKARLRHYLSTDQP